MSTTMSNPTTDLPRVTYTNIGEDFSGVHQRVDALIPEIEGAVLGRSHDNLIGGLARRTDKYVEVASPIDHELILGEFGTASSDLVDDAVAAAKRAFPSWRATPWPERLKLLRAAAVALTRRKYEISIACLLEVGKSRLEAIGEVEEAIDLINYYCDEMERADGFTVERSRAVANEASRVAFRPYGVFGVIAPFNFPVALSLGMTTAALVAGNTVVFKPGEASGLTGHLLVQCLVEGGLPDGVINLVFGGREAGEALVRNKDVAGFAFTGSNAVGMSILRAASAGVANRPVLAEMGGKNATFIAKSADLDIAASGLMRSAFGLQGQKCSACSKAYVAREIHDEFVDRLVALSREIVIGDPRRPDVFMGPIVNQTALARFEAATSSAQRDGCIAYGGERLSGGVFDKGAFVSPTIVTGLGADHPLNRDELFLPLVSLQPFDELQAAIDDSNRSDYGLTAGIYTGDDAELDYFLNTIEAGVLYANRASGATTGAWPGIQTFCGWKGSGTSGKGGLGPWYLPQFFREQSHTLFGAP